MKTATEVTDQQADGHVEPPLAKGQCHECFIYMGSHRMRCSRLDRSNAEAMREARAVEEYFTVRMK